MKAIKTTLNLPGIALFTVVCAGLPAVLATSSTHALPLTFHQSAGEFEGEGRPPSRTSGGSRNACQDLMIALVPGANDISVQPTECGTTSEGWAALTVAETPTFWFYIPPSFAAQPAEWVLLDAAGKPILVETIMLPETGGIFSLRTQQPLENGHTYQWFFSVLLNRHSPSENPMVSGIVKRIELDGILSSQLTAAQSPYEQVSFYAEHGIWQDAITTLIELRQRQPSSDTVADHWLSFLESVGLAAIANAPILDCCTAPANQ